MDRPGRPLDPRVRLAWWIDGAIFSLLAAGGLAVSVALLDVPAAVAVGSEAAVVVMAAIIPAFVYRRYRFQMRARDLLLSRGAISLKQTVIPFDRIQFVETTQGPLDRSMDLARVVVYTAAGKAAVIPGLRSREAESLREELSSVAGTQSV